MDMVRQKRVKYLANDERIKSASRQLRQGRISIRIFLMRCSHSVAEYEERMRTLALGQNGSIQKMPYNNIYTCI